MLVALLLVSMQEGITILRQFVTLDETIELLIEEHLDGSQKLSELAAGSVNLESLETGSCSTVATPTVGHPNPLPLDAAAFALT